MEHLDSTVESFDLDNSTPELAVMALCDSVLLNSKRTFQNRKFYDPAAAVGTIPTILSHAGFLVASNDIQKFTINLFAEGAPTDFLTDTTRRDVIVTHPPIQDPYVLWRFISHSLEVSNHAFLFLPHRLLLEYISEWELPCVVHHFVYSDSYFYGFFADYVWVEISSKFVGTTFEVHTADKYNYKYHSFGDSNDE